jgi:hypothetical protein
MKAVLIVAAVLMFGMHSVNAQNLSELAQFAESICRDIPHGEYTKTNIQGKVEAKVGLLAKLITGNATLDASKAKEVYDGIPFEKLPNNIPTVSMCKVEVIKILRSTPGKQSYVERSSDLRTVGRYLDFHGGTIYTAKDPCTQLDIIGTSELAIDDKTIHSSFHGRLINYRCPTATHRESSKEEECSANISELDDIIRVCEQCGRSSYLLIRCLTGSRCVSCVFDGVKDDVDALTVNVDNTLNSPQEDYDNFARALSRIISGGSDEAFCKEYPRHCQQ